MLSWSPFCFLTQVIVIDYYELASSQTRFAPVTVYILTAESCK